MNQAGRTTSFSIATWNVERPKPTGWKVPPAPEPAGRVGHTVPTMFGRRHLTRLGPLMVALPLVALGACAHTGLDDTAEDVSAYCAAFHTAEATSKAFDRGDPKVDLEDTANARRRLRMAAPPTLRRFYDTIFSYEHLQTGEERDQQTAQFDYQFALYTVKNFADEKCTLG